jgi:FixJ family two-component response regulator
MLNRPSVRPKLSICRDTRPVPPHHPTVSASHPRNLANRDIAQRLFVSEATVKTHVQRIMRKLDGKTRTPAVARARELMRL